MIATTSTVLPGRVKFRKRTTIPHPFTLLPLHPRVQQQATGTGRIIRSVQAYGSTVYIGFGDWTNNNGPVAVCGYDVNTHEPVNLFDPVPSEALDRYRVLDGHLYAPWTDPTNGNNGGFTTNRSGVWENVDIGVQTMIHTFDAIIINGRLHLCGSNYPDPLQGTGGLGVVWQEQPNGSWVKVLEGGFQADMTRFYYFRTTSDGRVWVQSTTGEVRTYYTTDGTNWTEAVGHPAFTPMIQSAGPKKLLPPGVAVPVTYYSDSTVDATGRVWVCSGYDVYVSDEPLVEVAA